MTETLPGFEGHLTFRGNLKATRYGWLRLTPAYSVHLVADLLDEHAASFPRVLDPYCGTGTTALVCGELGVSATTTDINPFLVWLARAKTASYSPSHLEEFEGEARAVEAAISDRGAAREWVPPLHQIEKWWDTPTLHALGRGMAAIKGRDDQVPQAVADLLRLAFCRTLIERASVSFGHQSMSFKKRKQGEIQMNAGHIVDLARASWVGAARALAESAASTVDTQPEVLLCDARELTATIDEASIDLVITSPPYPNRMSYIRELRPYMYWLGYLSDGRAAGELDWQAIGGTWGCATSNVGKWSPPNEVPDPHPDFQWIIREIAERSDVLSRYVHKYFYDMSAHTSELARVLAPGASVHYIVGNSKFYDVVLPVQDFYAGLFAQAGMEDIRIDVIRKRSSKRELFEYVVSGRRSP